PLYQRLDFTSSGRALKVKVLHIQKKIEEISLQFIFYKNKLVVKSRLNPEESIIFYALVLINVLYIRE
ncbi:MAG: hypothetical protein JZU65_20075, partial [Chlorobium sp.]|nr:hypothetical protein [Chlorobium sp.]